MPTTADPADVNACQVRRLDGGSFHEVPKNHPTSEQAQGALGPAAREPRWSEHGHCRRLEATPA
jgi:hypothetical protein